MMALQITFSTTDKLALEHFPPVPAKKLIPEWYKDVPVHLEEINAKSVIQSGMDISAGINFLTIKGCIPVADYLTSGYIIRAASDIVITPERDGDNKFFWWLSNHSKVDTHTHQQCPIKIKGVRNTYMKLISDWCVETPAGYSCYFYQPELFFEDRFKLFPAIVDTDSYNHQISFPGLVLAEENFVITAGTPLMVVFPFKREEWAMQTNHLKEKTPNPITLFIERAYKNMFHKQKKFN